MTPRPAQNQPLELLGKLFQDARVRVEHTWVGNPTLGRAPPRLGSRVQNPLYYQTRAGKKEDENRKRTAWGREENQCNEKAKEATQEEADTIITQ